MGLSVLFINCLRGLHIQKRWVVVRFLSGKQVVAYYHSQSLIKALGQFHCVRNEKKPCRSRAFMICLMSQIATLDIILVLKECHSDLVASDWKQQFSSQGLLLILLWNTQYYLQWENGHAHLCSSWLLYADIGRYVCVDHCWFENGAGLYRLLPKHLLCVLSRLSVFGHPHNYLWELFSLWLF